MRHSQCHCVLGSMDMWLAVYCRVQALQGPSNAAGVPRDELLPMDLSIVCYIVAHVPSLHSYGNVCELHASMVCMMLCLLRRQPILLTESNGVSVIVNA